MEREDTRLYKFDNIKILLMILVVIAHTLINSYYKGNANTFTEAVRFFCLLYTMPLFTFISGYLSRPTKDYKKLVNTLLIPCILFSIINDLIEFAFNEGYHFSPLRPGFAMWYLFVLFIYRITLPYAQKIKHLLPLSIIAAMLVGFIPQIGVDFSLSRLICFYPYFLLGHYLKQDKYKHIILKFRPLTGGGILLILYVVWFLLICRYPGYSFDTAFAGGFGINPVKFIIRTLLQLSVVVSAYAIILLIPNKPYNFTKYGRNTMSVYLLHSLIVLPCAYAVFPPFKNASPLQHILMVVLPTMFSILLFSDFISNKVNSLLKLFQIK